MSGDKIMTSAYASPGYGHSNHDNDRSVWPNGVAWNNSRAGERFQQGELVIARNTSDLYEFLRKHPEISESDCEFGKTWAKHSDWYTLLYLPSLTPDELAFRAEAEASA